MVGVPRITGAVLPGAPSDIGGPYTGLKTQFAHSPDTPTPNSTVPGNVFANTLGLQTSTIGPGSFNGVGAYPFSNTGSTAGIAGHLTQEMGGVATDAVQVVNAFVPVIAATAAIGVMKDLAGLNNSQQQQQQNPQAKPQYQYPAPGPSGFPS